MCRSSVPFTTWAAVSVIVLCGCAPSTDAKKRIKDSTPREVLETWTKAEAERDWETWFECMTPRARDHRRLGLIISGVLILSFTASTPSIQESLYSSSQISELALVSVVGATLLTIAAGWIPSMIASGQDPAEVLREE